MLQKLYSAEDLAERYGCSQVTARRYIRQMRHMENPLRATEQAVADWERGRTVESAEVVKQRIIREKARKAGQKRREGLQVYAG